MDRRMRYNVITLSQKWGKFSASLCMCKERLKYFVYGRQQQRRGYDNSFSFNMFYFIIRTGIGQKLYNIMIALSLMTIVLQTFMPQQTKNMLFTNLWKLT